MKTDLDQLRLSPPWLTEDQWL
ncbi:MAG: hypothetical protein QOE71_4222, partial [Pseudonocardiales bacterium]|nr:hypothetical protein [Pseudonocardiales bacterium]